eukprot:3527048-Amphidinium_carterae.1
MIVSSALCCRYLSPSKAKATVHASHRNGDEAIKEAPDSTAQTSHQQHSLTGLCPKSLLEGPSSPSASVSSLHEPISLAPCNLGSSCPFWGLPTLHSAGTRVTRARSGVAKFTRPFSQG